MDGLPVGYKAKGVLENASCMEERKRNTHDLLQVFLYPSKPGSPRVCHLIVHFILPKRENWYQMSSKKQHKQKGCLMDEQILFYEFLIFSSSHDRICFPRKFHASDLNEFVLQGTTLKQQNMNRNNHLNEQNHRDIDGAENLPRSHGAVWSYPYSMAILMKPFLWAKNTL